LGLHRSGPCADLYEAYNTGCYSEVIELLDNYVSIIKSGSVNSMEESRDSGNYSDRFGADGNDENENSGEKRIDNGIKDSKDSNNGKDSNNSKSNGRKTNRSFKKISRKGNNNKDNSNYNGQIRDLLFHPNTHTTNTHVLLVRALCYQKEHNWSRVESLTTEIVHTLHFEDQRRQKKDARFCLILGLWLRSSAHEALGNWEFALKDLEQIKTLIQSNDAIIFYSTNLLSPLLHHMAPFITRVGADSIFFNLHCVNDRLHRVSAVIAREESRSVNFSQEFELANEDNKSYHELAKTYHYRLCLKRPIHPYIHLNMWYTIDLTLVSEIGIYKEEEMDKVKGYSLACEILDIRSESSSHDNFSVEVRPLSEEACKWSELTNVKWPGIQGSKGGLGFRVVSKKLTNNSDFCNRQRDNLRYLHIYPIAEMVKNDKGDRDSFESRGRIKNYRIVPLLVGPIDIGHCYQHQSSCAHHQDPLDELGDECNFTDDSSSNSSPDSCSSSSSSSSPSTDSLQFNYDDLTIYPVTISPSSKHSWISDTYLINNYRAFPLPCKKTFVIEELWDGRVSGKVWDSAFIILHYMKDRFTKDQSSLLGKRILDLSTGTGLIGLYLAAFCSLMTQKNAVKKYQKTNIILTDLQHAINLIKRNRSLNQYLIQDTKVSTEITMLEWGNVKKAKKLGLVDIVLASDVVYEPGE
jgi:hypothetical protein